MFFEDRSWDWISIKNIKCLMGIHSLWIFSLEPSVILAKLPSAKGEIIFSPLDKTPDSFQMINLTIDLSVSIDFKQRRIPFNKENGVSEASRTSSFHCHCRTNYCLIAAKTKLSAGSHPVPRGPRDKTTIC